MALKKNNKNPRFGNWLSFAIILLTDELQDGCQVIIFAKDFRKSGALINLSTFS